MLISGTPIGEQLVGTAGDDTIQGFGGNDTIYGQGGNDSLDGGDGNDQLSEYSLAGSHTLVGGAGDDTLYGGTGNDTLQGGAGNDRLYGYSGSNRLEGGDGNDYISEYGDAGANVLDGGAGDDTLWGGSGSDTIAAGTGNDLAYGGAGATVYLVDATTTHIDDDGGDDTAIVSASFAKLPTSIEHVTYVNGALALPYWIDALLPDDANGLYYATLLGTAKTFGFGFSQTLPSYDTHAADAVGFSAFTPTQQAFTRQVLSYIQTVVDLHFVETTTLNAPNVLAFADNAQEFTAGYALNPSESNLGSDVFLDVNTPTNLAPTTSNYGVRVFLHEIGHALGLKHPGNYGGGDEGPYLPAAEDTALKTVMSYNDRGDALSLAYADLDIAALQYLYGPSKTARTGNDTYLVNAGTSNFVWDGAGTDTLDASAQSAAVTLSLQAGVWGFVGSKAATITSAGQVTVNFGSVIENLLGGSGNDSLSGNAAANSIVGGAGNDTITGGAGNDTLVGGTGNDTAVFSGRFADYQIAFDPASARYTVSSQAEGTDVLDGIESFQFSDGTRAVGTSKTGTAGRDTLTGTAGDDTIDGGAGLDQVTYASQKSAYTITLQDGVAHISGPDGNDQLVNVERVKFSDVYVAFDITGNAGQAYRLYQAALDRTPDIGGLGFQMKALDDGWQLWNIAQNFLDSPEFQAKYGALNNSDFVTQLYLNVLHRQPDAAGVAYHVNNLEHNGFNRWDVLIGFSESPENQANVIGAIGNGMTYTLS